MKKYEIIYYKEPRLLTKSKIFKDLKDLEDYVNEKQATVLCVQSIVDADRFHIQYEVDDE
jgi:hypothetical protein